MDQQLIISSKPIAELVEQINLLVYSSASARELKPSQWAALRFFDSASTNVRTVSGFAEMNCTTKSSASQTIATLVSKEWLERVPDETDGRRHQLKVTKNGRKLLENDPIDLLAREITGLPSNQQYELAVIVTRLYQEVYKNIQVDKDDEEMAI